MNRQGFSLVEVTVALVLLAAGMLALQEAVVRMVRQVSDDSRTASAIQLVEDRLELVRSDPQYDSLTARYTTTETSPGGVSGLTRVTAITRVRDSTAAGITDFRRITVSVQGSGLKFPISRTVSVAAP